MELVAYPVGIPAARIRVPARSERSAASPEFASDGRTVFILTLRDAAYRWDTRPEFAVDFACRLAGRDFTRSEWGDLFGEQAYQTTCPS